MSLLKKPGELTGMYELLDAVEAAIKGACPGCRQALAETIDRYAEDFPDDFYWAVGAQSPTLLSHLLMSIDGACRLEGSKSRAVIRLVDQQPEGNA
jgi:hypothetical protein